MYKLESVWVVILSEKNETVDVRAFTNHDLAKEYFLKLVDNVPTSSMLLLEEVPINSSKKYKPIIF
jgi:hypothetical protein